MCRRSRRSPAKRSALKSTNLCEPCFSNVMRRAKLCAFLEFSFYTRFLHGYFGEWNGCQVSPKFGDLRVVDQEKLGQIRYRNGKKLSEQKNATHTYILMGMVWAPASHSLPLGLPPLRLPASWTPASWPSPPLTLCQPSASRSQRRVDSRVVGLWVAGCWVVGL